ncbi:phytanoyl-CoA dioxygenase family protein [Planctomycetes bacterium Pan216]
MQQFAIVPEQADLDRLDRQFDFIPCEPTAPSTLSADKISQFNEQGFLTGITIYSAAEIDQIRSYFDALLERTLAEGGDAYSISSAHLRHGRVFDILTERRIVACVRDLFGDDVVGWGSHFFCKLPGDGKTVAWHQDASYWPLTPTRTVTVWLAIDDADCENGCMQFLPASHRHGHLPYRESDTAERNVLNQTVDAVERFGEPSNCVLKAGEISIHSDLLLHGSGANLSERRRCGLTLRYCPTSVRAHLGWNAKGVVVSGSDSSAHWANPKRPTSE